MSEDKRIIKTREVLCDALMKILENKPFEAVTVKEVCSLANISRITFYARYNDKSELLNNLYTSFGDRALMECIELNRKNNRGNDEKQFCINLFLGFSKLVIGGWKYMLNAVITEKAYAYDTLMAYLHRNTEEIVKKLAHGYDLNFSFAQTVSIMCDGSLSFLKATCFDPLLKEDEALKSCSEYYGKIINVCVRKKLRENNEPIT